MKTVQFGLEGFGHMETRSLLGPAAFDRLRRLFRKPGIVWLGLTLTYRNKPLARIVPLKEERLLSGDDPIYRMYELAEPIGAPLTNEEMDKLIYGR